MSLTKFLTCTKIYCMYQNGHVELMPVPSSYNGNYLLIMKAKMSLKFEFLYNKNNYDNKVKVLLCICS